MALGRECLKAGTATLPTAVRSSLMAALARGRRARAAPRPFASRSTSSMRAAGAAATAEVSLHVLPGSSSGRSKQAAPRRRIACLRGPPGRSPQRAPRRGFRARRAPPRSAGEACAVRRTPERHAQPEPQTAPRSRRRDCYHGLSSRSGGRMDGGFSRAGRCRRNGAGGGSGEWGAAARVRRWRPFARP